MEKRGRKVRKVYELNGVPGLVSSSKSHRTKTVVSVYNTAQAGLSTDESWPWAVTCEDHDQLSGCKTLPLAKAAASRTDEFCDRCREAVVVAAVLAEAESANVVSLEAIPEVVTEDQDKPQIVDAVHQITEPVALVG